MGSAGGAVFDHFGGNTVQMSTARTATSPTMTTNTPAAAKQKKTHTTTNRKCAGLTGERQDIRRNRRGTQWEHELIV